MHFIESYMGHRFSVSTVTWENAHDFAAGVNCDRVLVGHVYVATLYFHAEADHYLALRELIEGAAALMMPGMLSYQDPLEPAGPLDPVEITDANSVDSGAFELMKMNGWAISAEAGGAAALSPHLDITEVRAAVARHPRSIWTASARCAGAVDDIRRCRAPEQVAHKADSALRIARAAGLHLWVDRIEAAEKAHQK